MSAEAPERTGLVLSWGNVHGIPDDARAAWGARTIVNQGGMVDVVPDRSNMVGVGESSMQALRTVLNSGFLQDVLADVSALLRDYTMRTTEPEAFTWERFGVTIVADTMASHGYLYLCAFSQVAPSE